MATSKLKQFAAVMKDGQPHSWSGRNGTLYDYTLQMENGDVGIASSQKAEGSWTVGKEYNYDLEGTQFGFKFKNLKATDAPKWDPRGGGNKTYTSYWDKPEVVRSVTKNECLSIAILFSGFLPDNLKAALQYKNFVIIADYLYQFCYLGTEEKADTPNWSNTIIRRRQALRHSVEQIPYLNKEITDANAVLKDVIERATIIAEWITTPHAIHVPVTASMPEMPQAN